MRWIHYYLGRIIGRKYRRWYWNKHNHRYYWGFYRWTEDYPDKTPIMIYEPEKPTICGLYENDEKKPIEK